LKGDFSRRVPPVFSDAHAALRLHSSPFIRQNGNGPIPPGGDTGSAEQAMKCSDAKTGCASRHFFDGAERFCSAISLRGHVALNWLTANVQQKFSAISERVQH